MSKYTVRMRETFKDLKEKVDRIARTAADVFETDNLSMINMRIEDTLRELDELDSQWTSD